MIKLGTNLPTRVQHFELVFVTFIVWLAFISVPLLLGGMSLGWDALNHHIYLGWNAEGQRLNHDYLAAGVQAFQFPYTYWPAYRLAIDGVSGSQAGVILNSLYVLSAPPIWLISRACIPGSTVFDTLMRILGTLLAFMSGVIVSLLDTTNNDLLSAIPLIWAIALAIDSCNLSLSRSNSRYFIIAFSGLLTGVSVALKLSNGPIAILIPALWCACKGRPLTRLGLVITGSAATLIGFGVTYGYWGYLLWSHFGNPIFPFYDNLFDPVRRLTGWTP